MPKKSGKDLKRFEAFCNAKLIMQKNQEKIGHVFKTMVDKKESGRYIGRTEFDSVEVDNEVIIHSPLPLKTGGFVSVKMTKAYDFDLEGEVVASE